ncbi:hypothetical protein [Nocardia beijingensis]
MNRLKAIAALRITLYRLHDAPAPAPQPGAADLGLPPERRQHLVTDSPTITHTTARWLRAAFRHLDKLDTVTVLERILAVARARETSGGPPAAAD